MATTFRYPLRNNDPLRFDFCVFHFPVYILLRPRSGQLVFLPQFRKPNKAIRPLDWDKNGVRGRFLPSAPPPSIRIFPTAVNRSFMTAKAQKEGGRGKGKDDVGSSLEYTSRERPLVFFFLLPDNPATTKSLFHFHVLILISQSVRSVEGVGNGFLWKLRE